MSSEAEDDYESSEESHPKAPTSLVVNPVYDAYMDTDYKMENSIMQPYNQSGSFFVKVCVLTPVHM